MKWRSEGPALSQLLNLDKSTQRGQFPEQFRIIDWRGGAVAENEFLMICTILDQISIKIDEHLALQKVIASVVEAAQLGNIQRLNNIICPT